MTLVPGHRLHFGLSIQKSVLEQRELFERAHGLKPDVLIVSKELVRRELNDQGMQTELILRKAKWWRWYEDENELVQWSGPGTEMVVIDMPGEIFLWSRLDERTDP